MLPEMQGQHALQMLAKIDFSTFFQQNCGNQFAFSLFFINSLLPVLHGEYSENLEKESMAVKQVPTGSRRRLLMEK